MLKALFMNQAYALYVLNFFNVNLYKLKLFTKECHESI